MVATYHFCYAPIIKSSHGGDSMKRAYLRSHSSHNPQPQSQRWAVLFAIWIALIVPAAAYGVTFLRSGTTVVRVSGETIRGENNMLGASNYPALQHRALFDTDTTTRAQAEATLSRIHNEWAAKINVPVQEWKAVTLAPQNPKVIMIATGLDLYTSRDAGSRWERSINVLPGTFNALIISPANQNTLYAGIEGLGLYSSLDGGSTWTLFDSGIPLNPGQRFGITAIAIDPLDSQNIYLSAGVWGGAGYRTYYPVGIIRTEDGGKTWNTIIAVNDKAFDRLLIEQNTLHVWNGTQHVSYSIH